MRISAAAKIAPEGGLGGMVEAVARMIAVPSAEAEIP